MEGNESVVTLSLHGTGEAIVGKKTLPSGRFPQEMTTLKLASDSPASDSMALKGKVKGN